MGADITVTGHGNKDHHTGQIFRLRTGGTQRVQRQSLWSSACRFRRQQRTFSSTKTTTLEALDV
ncbi:Hypothetical protein FKW44_002409 [Caligus rogercresseyi]|uniref:Uncharacterized protein n=1 Tax=Caligus rogercresseyi TaxID=217165 RepID=A0A7T8QW93_CALRO|nr:Hypothetical protein FKW44_002409 [Caligus rogercresseyi]